MAVSIVSFPVAQPHDLPAPLPRQTTIGFRVASTDGAEDAAVLYDLDPDGPVRFAGNGHRIVDAAKARPAGTPVSRAVRLAGPAPAGTLVTVLVTVIGQDGVSDIAPCSVAIT